MKQSIIIISLILMAILTLLAGWRISQQDKTIREIERIVIELVKRQDTNKKNVEFLYKKVVELQATTRLLKNGGYK